MNISVTCRIEFQLYSSYFGFGLTTLDKTGWKQLPLEQMEHCSGAPNDNFWKISVRKTIWDLEFSEHLLLNFLLARLS